MGNSNEGLLLHLKLDEITNGQVADASGNVGPGTINGDLQLVPDDTFGSALSFGGSGDYVDLPTSSIPKGNEITVSFWAKGGDSLPKQNSIIGASDAAKGRVLNIHLPWKDSIIYFDCGNVGASYDRISKSAQAADFKGQWTHWAFTKDAAKGVMKIYLNGALWHSGTGKNKPLLATTAAKLGTNAGGGSSYPGQIANVRIYSRALAVEEIRQDMEADLTAAASFRQSYPLEFSVYDDDDQQVLYIDDNLEDHSLRLEIDNASPQAIELAASSNGSAATAANHHFELRFRPGALSEASQSQIALAEEAGWNMSPAQVNANGTVSLYFLNTGTDLAARTLDPAEKIALTLYRVSADGGGGSRGTRVELTYQQLAYAGDTTPLSGSRIKHLSIVNRRGQKNIPLHVGFVGSNTILNDGKSSNALTLRIANTLKDQAIALNPSGSDAPTKFILSFDVQAEDELKEWALGTTSQVEAIEVAANTVGEAVRKAQGVADAAQKALTEATNSMVEAAHKLSQVALTQKAAKAQKDLDKATTKQNNAAAAYQKTLAAVDAAKATMIAWDIDIETQGISPEWILTTPNKSAALAPEEIIQLDLSKIITALPSGHTNLYLHYENIPGYWDGQFVVSIEKSPLLYRSEHVGIGVADPKVPLHVSGETGDDAGKGRANSGFVIIGDAAGKHIAIDDNEIMAKADGTTSATLSLNYEGGDTYIGGKTSIKGDLDVAGRLQATGPGYSQFDGLIVGNKDTISEDPGKLFIFSELPLTVHAESPSPKGTWLQLNNSSEKKNNIWDIVATGSKGADDDSGKGKLVFKHRNDDKGNPGPALVTLDSSGNVGIGTAEPKTKLNVSGGTDAAKGKANSGFVIIGDAAGKHIAIDDNEIMAKADGTTSGTLSLQYEGGEVYIGGDLGVKGSKNFLIDHPSRPGYQLVHSCLEGPEVGVYYRGNASLENGEATICLPPYFEALTRTEGRTVHLTAKGREPFLLSYEEIVNGQFKVYGTRPDGAFSWEVKAVRADVAELEVEVEIEK